MPYRFRVLKGPEPEKVIALQTDALTFGTSADADVVFPTEGVSPLHARITVQGGQLMLEDLGSQTGTFRNGTRLLGPLQLFSGDKIGFGGAVTLLLEGEGEEEAQAAEKDAIDVSGLDSGFVEGGLSNGALSRTWKLE